MNNLGPLPVLENQAAESTCNEGSAMLTISEITRFLGEFAPLPLAESWDNVGLLIGDTGRSVSRILTCLTVTPDVVEEAVANQVDLIVTHHPLMFKPIQRLVASDMQGAMLLKLVEAGIAVYSPHTAFDSAADGINQQLAQSFNLRNIKPLRALPNLAGAPFLPDGFTPGSGRYGDLPYPHALNQLCETAKTLLKVTRLQRVGEATHSICRVGIACGAAAEYIPDALAAGCDALVTGEARFHDCLRARDSGLALILPGHYATERPAVESLAQVIRGQFKGITVTASTREHDPVEIV